MSSDLKSIRHQYNLKAVKAYKPPIYEFEDFCLDAAHLMLSRNGEELSLAPNSCADGISAIWPPVATLPILVSARAIFERSARTRGSVAATRTARQPSAASS